GMGDAATKSSSGFSKIAKSSGISELPKILSASHTAANDLARAAESILPPMAELGAMATVGGLADLPYRFGEFARSMSLASKFTGMSTSSLSQWEGASRAAGIEAGTMTQTMQGFSDAIEGAVFGRNPELFNLAKRLNISLMDGMHNALDPDKVLDQVATAIDSNPNPKIKSAIINAFGLNSIGALLIDGTKGLSNYREIAGRTGLQQSDEDIEKGAKFAKVVLESKAAVEGLALSIGSELIPVFQPLLQEFNVWEETNRKAFAGEVKNDVIAFKDALVSVSHSVKDGIDAVGGWHNAFIILEAYIAGTFLASVLRTIGTISSAFIASPLGRIALLASIPELASEGGK